MSRTDFPGAAVDAGLEFQAAHHFAGGRFGVGVAYMLMLTIDIVCVDGVDHCAHDAFTLALGFQFVVHVLVFGDEREVQAERSEEHTSELQSLMRSSYAV